MIRHTVVLEMSLLEAAHLTDIVGQFQELLDESVDLEQDPAVARLVPDAYTDDAAAADEFRRLTQNDLLDRRRADAALLVTSLLREGERLDPSRLDRTDAETTFTVSLDAEHTGAWLRTLAALRLVLAGRLGIDRDDDHLPGDPRFGVYDWLGYRLDGLVRALEG